MLEMLQRLLELKDILPPVLAELSASHLNLTQMELEVVSELAENLRLIEITALALGRRDANLIKADKAFNFLLANMEQNTWIGEQLYVAVKARIQERRIPDISSLLRYLEDPIGYESLQESSELEFPTKNDLAKAARDLYLRLFSTEKEDEAQGDIDENDNEPVKKLSKVDELEALLSVKSTTVSKPKLSKSNPKNPEDLGSTGHVILLETLHHAPFAKGSCIPCSDVSASLVHPMTKNYSLSGQKGDA